MFLVCVHYVVELAGCLLGKWVLGENSFSCEHNSMRANDLGNGNILKKFAVVKFLRAGLGDEG